MKLNRTKQFEALIKIAEAITADPNTNSDGECLDIVWQILEREGFNLERIMISKGYRN
jgi:hypothetical protein